MSLFNLDGRIALITGGSQGLGFAMARALAEAGANVVVTSRQSEKAQASAAAMCGLLSSWNRMSVKEQIGSS